MSTGHNGVAWKCMKRCNFGYVIGSGIGVKHIESWNPHNIHEFKTACQPRWLFEFFTQFQEPHVFSSFSSICLFSRGSVTLSWKISTNSDKLFACTSCLDFCSKHPLTVAKKSMRALFLEWIDSCEAYSELFGLAGGLQAGKMMLRRGCLARVTHDSTKAVDGDDVSLFCLDFFAVTSHYYGFFCTQIRLV